MLPFQSEAAVWKREQLVPADVNNYDRSFLAARFCQHHLSARGNLWCKSWANEKRPNSASSHSRVAGGRSEAPGAGREAGQKGISGPGSICRDCCSMSREPLVIHVMIITVWGHGRHITWSQITSWGVPGVRSYVSDHVFPVTWRLMLWLLSVSRVCGVRATSTWRQRARHCNISANHPQVYPNGSWLSVWDLITTKQGKHSVWVEATLLLQH